MILAIAYSLVERHCRASSKAGSITVTMRARLMIRLFRRSHDA